MDRNEALRLLDMLVSRDMSRPQNVALAIDNLTAVLRSLIEKNLPAAQEPPKCEAPDCADGFVTDCIGYAFSCEICHGTGKKDGV